MSLTHPHFVPSDAAGDRRSTAILLVGTADEKGIDQREVATTHTGFYVSDAIADALAEDGIDVRRGTNPYASVDGPLADRRLDINSDAVGPTGTPSGDGSPRLVKTVDGDLADRRLDLHSDEAGTAPRDLRDQEDEFDLAEDEDEDDLDLDEDEDEDEDEEVEETERASEADEDDEEDDEEEGTYDPAEMVDQGMKPIQAFVTENPEQAETILAAEQAHKDRPKMVEWLNDFIANRGPATGADL